MHVLLAYKLAHALHKLCAPTMILRAIIQIDDSRGNMRQALTDRLPPLDDPIHEAVPGHLGGDAVHQQRIRRREQDADGRHGRLRLKIVVRCIDLDPTLSPTGAGADFDDGLGVRREPHDVVRHLSGVIHGGDLREDGVGCGAFFCGCLLATFLG